MTTNLLWRSEHGSFALHGVDKATGQVVATIRWERFPGKYGISYTWWVANTSGTCNTERGAKVAAQRVYNKLKSGGAS